MSDPKLGGWRPEPSDDRDLPISEFFGTKLAANFSTAVDLRPACSPVENQSSLSSCVGNAVIGALELLENERGDPFVNLARLFVYFNARAAMQETDRDEGSYIRDAMNSLATFGVCPEDVWPYDIATVLIRPSWKAYRQAYGHRINKFYKIFSDGDDRINEIESALRSRHPVIFGTPVFSAIRTSTGPIAMPSGASLGGHAMLIVGFDSVKRHFIIRNSWGTGWGDHGYGYMPYEYLDAAGASDFWVATL